MTKEEKSAFMIVDKEDLAKIISEQFEKLQNEKKDGISADDRVYTIAEACQIAKMGKTKLQKYILCGQLPKIKLGRLTRIRHKDLMDLINDRLPIPNK